MAHIRTTNATVREHFDGQYECPHCGLDVPAIVYATGYGGAQGHGDDSSQEALDNANYNASSVATRTLLYVPCPKCGKRQPGAIGYRIQVIVGAAILAIGLAALLVVLMQGRYGRDSSDMTMGEGTAVVVFAFFYYWWGRPWRGVKKRTSIDMERAVFHKRDDD
ncbi:MAG TPA: hypothetical protein VGM90_31635 [Kofleriaceae bacterium]|jgi:predicted RNA-binding Zn-ribbon protein involved in translation (DUF1610 family)